MVDSIVISGNENRIFGKIKINKCIIRCASICTKPLVSVKTMFR